MAMKKPSKAAVKEVMRYLGSIKSAKKAASSARNGRLSAKKKGRGE